MSSPSIARVASALLLALGAPSECPRGGAAPLSSAARAPMPSDSSSQPSALAPLFQAQMSAYAAAEEQILRDQAAWAVAWARLHGGEAAEPAPVVDFARDMVVLVAAGRRTSGGVTVRVDAVEPDGGGGAVVRYTVTEPGAGCMTTQALTAPVAAARAPRAAGAVRFERRTARAAC